MSDTRTVIEMMDDSHLSSYSIFKQFYTAMSNNDVETAQSILSSNPSILNQITNSENINELINITNARELEPKTDIDYFLDDLNEEFQEKINNTIVMGIYSSTVQYEAHNLVYYNNKGYYAKSKPPIGTLPTDTTYWSEYNIKGLQGYGGIALNFRYSWDSTVQYYIGDVVIYQNKIWMAIADNISFPPNTYHYPWALIMMPAPQKKTLIQTDSPSNYPDGSLWFRVMKGRSIKQNVWKHISDNPYIKYASYTFVIGNDIYIVAGEDATFHPSNTVYAFNVLTKTWAQKASLPNTYATTNCNISYGNYGYIVAGETGSLNTPTKDFYRYDSNENTWTKLADLPTAAESAAICVGDYIYAIGGLDDNRVPINIMYIYDIAAGTWSTGTRLLTSRAFCECREINNKIYAMGGLVIDSEYSVTPTTSCEVYDITTKTWSYIANMPTARYCASGFVKDTDVYIIGGCSSQTYALNTNEKYDTTTNTWREEIPMEYPRSSLVAHNINNKGYALCGINIQNSEIVAPIEEYLFTDSVPDLEFQVNMSANESYTIPTISGGTYNYYIDWGDETISSIITTYNDSNRTHTYTTAGEYTIKLFGTCTLLQFGSGTNANNLLSIDRCSLNLGSGYKLFYNCTNLTSVVYDIFHNASSITTFESAFENCSALTNISGELFLNNSSATNFSRCFYGCENLNSLPSNLFYSTHAAQDLSYCFASSGISTIPYGLFLFNTNITNLSYCFSGCTNIGSLPKALFNPCILNLNCANMFQGCTSLSSIVDGVFGEGTSSATNFNNMFSGNTNLRTLGIIDMGAATSTTGMFTNCSALETVNGFVNLAISFDISSSPNLTTSSLLNIIDNLSTITTTQTATFGSTNLAKLTSEQLQVLTDKGWNYA